MYKNILLISLFFLCVAFVSAQEKINVVVIGAHPDDCDIHAGGTALRFADAGHNVLFVSVTNGDAGHHEKGGGALATIRRAEAQEAGRRLGVKYVVLDYHDGELKPTLEVRHSLIRLIREWNADIVIGPRPYDYHPDHRNTAIALQDAAFMVIVPNIASDTPALKKNPVFLYVSDRFKKPYPFIPEIAVDITDVYPRKVRGIAAHESQVFEWLPWLNGVLDQVPESEAERLEWVGSLRKPKMNNQIRECLIKWYGEAKGRKIEMAEAFEICEYGHQPTESEIRALFPMLNER